MVEREQDENKHRVRKWYVAKGIDQREVSLRGRDEGKAGKGGTPEKTRAKSNQLRRAFVRPQQQQHGNARNHEET